MPANKSGASFFFFSSSVANCSLADLINWRSLVRLSRPIRSTTLKNCPSPACFRALISSVLGDWVMAVENKANSLLLFLCPVWSVKAVGYTATTGLTVGISASRKYCYCNFSMCTTSCALNLCSYVSTYWSKIEQLESEATNRNCNNRDRAICFRNFKC